MTNILKLYEYGDMPPWGKGPDQNKLRNKGRSYIEENFPKLDYIESCAIMNNRQVLGGLGLPPVADKSMSDNIIGGNEEATVAKAAGGGPSTLTLAALVVMLVSLWGLIRLSLSKGRKAGRRVSIGRAGSEEAFDSTEKLI